MEKKTLSTVPIVVSPVDAEMMKITQDTLDTLCRLGSADRLAFVTITKKNLNYRKTGTRIKIANMVGRGWSPMDLDRDGLRMEHETRQLLEAGVQCLNDIGFYAAAQAKLRACEHVPDEDLDRLTEIVLKFDDWGLVFPDQVNQW